MLLVQYVNAEWNDKIPGAIAATRSVSLWRQDSDSDSSSIQETKVSETRIVEQTYEFVQTYGASVTISAEATGNISPIKCFDTLL
jgi:hypothetical protein